MADVANHATLPTNLISYWELEEASGTRVDAHGSNDLTDNNTVTQTTGKVGNCASFDDANSEYFSSSFDAATEIGTGDFSVSLWFKVANADKRRTMFCFDNGAWTTYFNIPAGRNSDGNDIRVNFDDGATGGSYTSDADHQDNAWHHLAFTRDSTVAKLYIDGTLVDTDTNAHNDMSVPADLHIGRFNGAAAVDYMDGELDQIGLWDKVLSSTEVTDLYNSGDGLVYDDGGGGGGSTFIPRVMTY